MHFVAGIKFFRTFVGQYKRKDKVEVDGKEVETPLPIITIYLLGFKLPETDAVAIHITRTYYDMINHCELHLKSVSKDGEITIVNFE